MMSILVLKQQLKNFYEKFDIYIASILKFLGAFFSLTLINSNIGYMERINKSAVVLIVALICSFLPVGGTVLICALFVLAHFYTISLELALITLCIYILMFTLFLRFESKESYAILLTPILFFLKIPYAVPLLMGLIGGFSSAIPVSFGVVLYYLIIYVKNNVAVLSNSDAENILQRFTLIIDSILHNDLMIITVVVFCITLIVVHIIKRLSIDYSWSIAIGIGAAVNIIFMLIGSFILDVSGTVAWTIIGTIISAAIVYALQFFIFAVDYSRTERVQFEDDEYVYFVKAVPKVNVTTVQVNVKRINAQRSRKSTK